MKSQKANKRNCTAGALAADSMNELGKMVAEPEAKVTTGSTSPRDTKLSASTANSLGEPAADVGRQPQQPDHNAPATAATPDQKLHGANFDGDPEPDPSQEESNTSDSGEEKIDRLLDEIGQGLVADDTTNVEKLTIARKYGALLLELKELVPHGKFQETLRDRFPKVSYSKCNRWMWLAEREAQVAEAIEKYPDVSWGPKKMIDFLNESWRPEEEDEEDDEDDAYGYIEDGPMAGAEPNIVVVRHQEETEQEPTQPSHAVPRGTSAGPVVQAVPTPSGNSSSRPSRKKKRSASHPAAPAAARKATTFGDRLSEARKALDELSEMQLPIGDDLRRCLSDAEAIGARVVALLTKLHEANTADRADLTV